MSKSSELHNLYYSFSGDRQINHKSRSGDENGRGAALWDYVCSVQSAEADIIEDEERAERQQAKRKFARLLGLYYKKILSPVEFKFLVASINRDKTPYAVGRILGVDYNAAIDNINAKHKANLPKLLQLMRAVGYDYRHGMVLMPEILRYKKRRLNARKWWAANRERLNARARELYDPKKAAKKNAKTYEIRRKYYYEIAKPRLQANREAHNAYNREWYKKNKEKICAARKVYYAEVAKPRQQANRKARNARDRQRYKQNREKICAARKVYRDVHKDEINARRRAREAAKRLARQQQTAQERAEA